MTEDDLKLNNVTVEIKRNYQAALANLESVKVDTSTLLEVKQKVETELAAEQEKLNKVKNEISQEKLNWATFKHEEMVKLDAKNSDADNILKRKAELNEQEQKLREIEAATIEARNETRQLELKIETDKDGIKVEKRDLTVREKQLEEDKLKILKDREIFKEKVTKVLQEVEKL